MAAVVDWFRRARSGYAPLPDDGAADRAESQTGHNRSAGQQHLDRPARSDRTRRVVKIAGIVLMVSVVGSLAVVLTRSRGEECDNSEHGFQCGTAVSRSWGQYSPYFSVPSEIDPGAPEGCDITFAQVLSRHGARAPTLGKAIHYAALIDKIHNGAIYYSPGFDFLRIYNYTLGADQLTQMGQQQMVNSGLKFYHRYRPLARQSLPFIRTAGQDRVVHSAENFTQGFHSALLADRRSTLHPTLPYDMVIIPETAGTNNSLSHGLCTVFEDTHSGLGDAAQADFLSTFVPAIAARFNTKMPGTNITESDVIHLMDLCPFETVASPSADPLAPFCQLFSAEEWRGYDYFQTLGKWYGYGPGGPLGPTQGVGFVNELLARLTGQPVRDGTSTNRTLDADEKTFPLGRALYADFSHDNDMMGVLGALGVYDGVKWLDNSTRQEPEEIGGFAASWAVPFASRIYVEKMRCKPRHAAAAEGKGSLDAEEEMVRVLVNDRVIKLRGCGADDRGLCTLSKFVESMSFARRDGEWDKCFI
ncbi:histidine phosphatase superfamily [Dichotomopilus funicola]|uniref:3-phytase n=1 Tax=Dichotomopilus funicola TaxID=1934379 RepID=A0AAN6V0F9_9PEZI|nr:histidine phosphatase superfamily [Dichotomopilus funicola]